MVCHHLIKHAFDVTHKGNGFFPEAAIIIGKGVIIIFSSQKTCSSILFSCKGFKISLTCVLKEKWHLFLSRLSSVSREKVLRQRCSLSCSSLLFRLTIPIIPHPRAVLLAYGSASLPGMICRSFVALYNLLLSLFQPTYLL